MLDELAPEPVVAAEATAGAILPFDLSIDPRARLLLFDLADDPDYTAIEVQVVDDAVHGSGMLVLLARHDGIVDVYRAPGLRLDRTSFSIGRGVGEWRETEISPASLLIADDGAAVDVGLTDAAGRRVEITIDDRDGRPRRRSTLLAPVGSGVERPLSFFVVLMRGFDLGRTTGRPPRVAIGGVERRVVVFPGPVWLHRRRFLRYSADPIVAVLNPAHDGPLTARVPGTDIPQLRAVVGRHAAALRFEPAFPDVRTLRPGGEVTGRWALDVGDEPGLTGGTWSVLRTADVADIAMAVTQPWTPRDLPLSLRVVTTVARVFRTWPTTYRWEARLDLGADPPLMASNWSRTQGPDRDNAYQVRRPRLPVLGGVLAAVGAAVLIARRRSGRRG